MKYCKSPTWKENCTTQAVNNKYFSVKYWSFFKAPLQILHQSIVFRCVARVGPERLPAAAHWRRYRLSRHPRLLIIYKLIGTKCRAVDVHIDALIDGKTSLWMRFSRIISEVENSARETLPIAAQKTCCSPCWRNDRTATVSTHSLEWTSH